MRRTAVLVVVVVVVVAVAALGYGAAQATSSGVNSEAGSGGGDVVAAGGSPPAVLSAVVTARGDLVRGTGATDAYQRRLGSYEVSFDQNVRSCAYVATVGSVGIGVAPSGEIGTAGSTKSPRGVIVGTFNSTGGAGNRSFHLIVRC